MNAMKTTLLLGLLSGLLIVGGGAIAGERGLTYGLVMAVGMNFFSYFFSEKMALLSARAQRVSENEYPEIYARLPRPSSEHWRSGWGYRCRSSGLLQTYRPTPSPLGGTRDTLRWL